MNTKVLFVLVAAASVAVGYLASDKLLDTGTQPAQAPTPAAAGKPLEPVLTLPDFSLANRAGQPQSIRSWPGKSLVINFWATWCAPCRREIPMLIDLQQRYAANGVQLVGIALDFRDDVLKYADAMKINYPLLIGEQEGYAAADAFGIEAVGLPYTVFTDAKGNILTTHIGELKLEQAELILDTVKRVNSGELRVGVARTELTTALSNLKAAVASDT